MVMVKVKEHISEQKLESVSVSTKKKRVQFGLDEDINCKVYLAGDFNNWEPEQMKYDPCKHLFTKTKMLLPGRYEYKFVVDGTWVIDAQREDFIYNDRGSMNSMLIVES